MSLFQHFESKWRFATKFQWQMLTFWRHLQFSIKETTSVFPWYLKILSLEYIPRKDISATSQGIKKIERVGPTRLLWLAVGGNNLENRKGFLFFFSVKDTINSRPKNPTHILVPVMLTIKIPNLKIEQSKAIYVANDV